MNVQLSYKIRSLILALISILLWSTLAITGVKLKNIPIFYLLSMAFFLGSFPILINLKKSFSHIPVFIFGSLAFFLYHFLLFYSFKLVNPVEANLINYLWPIILILLTPFFFKNFKIRWYHLLGALLSFSGCIALVKDKINQISIGSWIGYLMAFGAAITWPLYTLIKRKITDQVNLWQISGFCFGSAVLCFMTHKSIEPEVILTHSELFLILYLGIGPFGLAFYAWDYAVKYCDPRILGSLSYLTPLLSTFLLIFYNDRQTDNEIFVAMAFIFCGLCLGLMDLAGDHSNAE